MLIAILDFAVAPENREAAFTQLSKEASEVRDMPGNINFRAFAARDDEAGITVLHEWDDADSFGGYLASDAFARSGAVLRPMMTSAPVSRRLEAALLETVR